MKKLKSEYKNKSGNKKLLYKKYSSFIPKNQIKVKKQEIVNKDTKIVLIR